MDSYPKFQQIPTLVLEKVITKCKMKSYFCLQQTCRDILEFIKNSKRICVHLGLSLRAEHVYKENYKVGPFFVVYKNENDIIWVEIPIENLYGVRLRGLNFARLFFDTSEELDTILDIFKKNRIQCGVFSGCVIDWTLDQFTTMLKLLKPVRVEINTGHGSDFSSYYEQILMAKQVKVVDLVLSADDFFLIVKQYITTFPAVRIHVLGPPGEDIDVTFEYCNTILQILHTERPQNLREFYFSTQFGPRYPTVDEIEQHFRNCNPRVQINTNPQNYSISAWLDLPDNLPSNSFCKVCFGNDGRSPVATINYTIHGPGKKVPSLNLR